MGCIKMPAGIEIYNDNGYLQITDSYRNLQCTGKGTVKGYTDLYLPSDTLYYAFNCSTSRVGILYSNWDTTNNAHRVKFATTDNSDAMVTYYTFSYPTPIFSKGMFEVYDANSNLVFSDNGRYMKVIDSRSGTLNDSQFYKAESLTGGITIESINTPFGRTTAILPGLLPYRYRVPNAPTGLAIWGAGFTFNNGSILFQTCCNMVIFPSMDGYFSENPNYNFLVLDVTGL